MGATQSIPSEVEGIHFATTQPPRNKLTKPRTNSSITREASCLPSLPPSLSRLSPSGNSKSPPAVQYQIIEDQPYGAVLATEYFNKDQPNDTRQSVLWPSIGDRGSELPAYFDPPPPNSISGVDSILPTVTGATPVNTGMRRRESIVTRSSTNSSGALPLNRNSEIPLVGTVRRRSQLLAAPPATATRKPVKPHQQSQILPGSLHSLEPYALTLPSDSNAGRCTTPSGYSVLGAFKRGSLRIANGAVSPALSSSRASPELSVKTGYFGSNLALPETSSGKSLVVIADSVIPTHEVRLVPPSPTDWNNGDKDKIPGSPFSFIQSPSIYNENTSDSSFKFYPPANDIPKYLQQPICRPTDSCESLISIASSAISIGYEYHRILTQQCLDKGSDKLSHIDSEMPGMFTSTSYTETDEYHKILFKEAQKGNVRHLQQQGITKVDGGSTDSGYSSSGSVDSWKTAWSGQHAEQNSMARRPGTFIGSKDPPISSSVEAVCTAREQVSRRKSVVAAIRRRYSQGDLKAFARRNEGTRQPPIPTVPVLGCSKSLWKPLPELKHRRSMITVKMPAPHTGLPEIPPDIQPVPPLPRRGKLERKGAFNLLNVEDYLPLVEQYPLTPVIDHATNATSTSFDSTHSNTQDSIMRIGVGRALNRGSRITGQDYYQRFSRRQHKGAEMMVG